MTDLFTKHHSLINSVACNYFHNYADQEDAMQEAFIKFMNIEIIGVENEAALVRVIASNFFTDLYNKEWRMRDLDQQAAIIEDIDDNDPLHNLQQYTEGFEVSRRLEDMPSELALVAKMYYLQGLSYKEVAEKLNLPEGTIASRLNTARRYFQGEYI